LHHLNASPERIQAFAAKYGSFLEPPRRDDISPAHMYSEDQKDALAGDQSGQITDENFQLHLGKRKYFEQYFKYFQEKFGDDVTEHRRDEVVRHFFPILSHGSLHSALHPLIHLGWSLSLPVNISLEMTIEGLAWCAFAHFEYDKQPSADDSKEIEPGDSSRLTPIQTLFYSKTYLSKHVAEVENGVLRVPYRDMKLGEFQRSMVFISQHYRNFISDCCRQLAVPHDRVGMLSLIADLLDIALLSYAVSDDDFFVLHICTALMGVVHIAPRLDDAHLADTIRLMVFGWIMVWQAQQYNGVGHAFMRRLAQCKTAEAELEELISIDEELKAETKDLDWASLIEQTIQLDDEHTLKLVHVCHYCDQHRGRFKALYKYVANKRLQHTLLQNEQLLNSPSAL